jgi:hypothetical protein
MEKRRRLEPSFDPGLSEGIRRTTGPAVDAPRARPGNSRLRLMAVIAAPFLAFVGLPLALEEATGPCQALERRFITVNVPLLPRRAEPSQIVNPLSITYGRMMATGDIAAGIVKARHPVLPSVATCTGWYWTSLVDPSRLGMGLRLRGP